MQKNCGDGGVRTVVRSPAIVWHRQLEACSTVLHDGDTTTVAGLPIVVKIRAGEKGLIASHGMPMVSTVSQVRGLQTVTINVIDSGCSVREKTKT